MAFFNSIADDRIGGTYMTLLNTVANLSAKWPMTLALAVVDPLSFKDCLPDDTYSPSNSEQGKETIEESTEAPVCPVGMKEVVYLDGFYLLTFFGLMWGIVWYVLCARRARALETWPKSAWKVPGALSGAKA